MFSAISFKSKLAPLIVVMPLFFTCSKTANTSNAAIDKEHSKIYDCVIATEYISEQFDDYNIIGIDEGPHGTLQTHELLRGLFESRPLIEKIDFVIVEFANSKYQPLLDRFVLGEYINDKDLQNLWRHSTQAHSITFQRPVYLMFLKAIREANRRLDENNKIRVIAGDPIINWSEIKSLEEYFQAIAQRDIFPSELAIELGINYSNNVLLVFGGEHLKKSSDQTMDSTHWTIPFYINSKYPKSMISIGVFSANDYSNDIDCNHYSVLNLVRDEKSNDSSQVQSHFVNKSNQKDDFDAVYYVGSPKDWIQDIPYNFEKQFWEELNRRSNIVWGEDLDRKFLRKQTE